MEVTPEVTQRTSGAQPWLGGRVAGQGWGRGAEGREGPRKM